MRKTAITVGLLVLSASTSVGCKSAQKLAWWKTTPGDEAALAHAAPELPSDAAKKAETTSTQVAAAPTSPFKSKTSGSGYPSTDAPPFTSGVVTPVASNVASGAAGPYDPNATPAAKPSSVATTPVGGDRYGLGGTSYASTPVVGTTPGMTPPVSEVSPKVDTTADLSAVADRYGLPPSGAPGASTPPVNYSPAVVMPVSNVATTTPYRPGGTSTYNVSMSVAEAPKSTAYETPTAGGTTTSQTPTEYPAPATGSNRYR